MGKNQPTTCIHADRWLMHIQKINLGKKNKKVMWMFPNSLVEISSVFAKSVRRKWCPRALHLTLRILLQGSCHNVRTCRAVGLGIL